MSMESATSEKSSTSTQNTGKLSAQAKRLMLSEALSAFCKVPKVKNILADLKEAKKEFEKDARGTKAWPSLINNLGNMKTEGRNKGLGAVMAMDAAWAMVQRTDVGAPNRQKALALFETHFEAVKTVLPEVAKAFSKRRIHPNLDHEAKEVLERIMPKREVKTEEQLRSEAIRAMKLVC